MRAVSYDRYGGVDVLRETDLPKPEPRSGEIRLRVLATSINPLDGKIRRGELGFLAGGHFPKQPGIDVCGIVDALGPGVGGFRDGERLFGCVKAISAGAFAEYVIVDPTMVARAPASLDDVTAASLPTVAIAALQVLRDKLGVTAKHRVLVNGCTGGVGLMALQVARNAGAEVTGVCSAAGADLAKAYGATHVRDYHDPLALQTSEPYRAILELSGKLDFARAEGLLDAGGLYVDFSPTPAALIGNTIANPFRSHKHVFALTKATSADLTTLADALAAGELRAPPVAVFELAQFAEAFAAAERGGAQGKIAVRVATRP